jgi:hypothetical protein
MNSIIPAVIDQPRSGELGSHIDVEACEMLKLYGIIENNN